MDRLDRPKVQAVIRRVVGRFRAEQSAVWAAPAIVLLAGSASLAGDSELSGIAAILKARWASIASLEIESRDVLLAPSGRVDPEFGVVEQSFSLGPDGRRAFRMNWVHPDGRSEQVLQFREDGRKAYGVLPFHGHPNSISTLEIAPQLDDSDAYSGGMSGLIWLLMPAGRPMHWHLERQATYQGVGEDGDPRILVQAEGHRFVATLSRHHDYQPRRIEMDGGYLYETSRFQSVQGHWLPAEGVYTNPHGADAALRRFQFAITRVDLNEPIADSVFGRPETPDGVVIHDRTQSDPRKDHTIQGGWEARKRLESQHKPPLMKATSRPVRAERQEREYPWSISLLIGSGLAVLLACVWKWRSVSH